MADDLGEKTEDATPKRKNEARQQGQIARSIDLSAVVLLAVGTVAIAALAGWMMDRARVLVEYVLAGAGSSEALDPARAGHAAWFLAGAALRTAAPVILIAWVAGVISQITQVGLVLTPAALTPSLNKLNPINGIKEKFGVKGMVKAGLDVLKVIVVMAVAYVTIRPEMDRILLLPYLPMMQAIVSIGSLMIDLALRLLAVLLVLGFLDFWYRRWQHAQDLKMTKQQVKDEMKSAEGDPEVKQRRMRMQQQIAVQRISAAVPQADVIVTNPEHLAIAIKYDADSMGAPKVIAKGADLLAQRIRTIAMQHGIPIVERKPLARALYRDVAVGQEVPPDFYAAVAEVLAYVYRLNGKMAS